MILRHGQKDELERLARRNAMKFIVADTTAVEGMIASYMRDRQGWVYVWAVEFDGNDELKHAQEILVYDSEHAPDAMPKCVLDEAFLLAQWDAVMAMDPSRDERYYDPVPGVR